LSDRAFTFEIRIPSTDGSIRFVFGNRDNRDHIASLIRANGLANYEAPMPSVFARLAQQASGLALDIGANTGVFELLAAAANPQLRVCAFEPLESVRELLYETWRAIPISPRASPSSRSLCRVPTAALWVGKSTRPGSD